MVQSGTRSGRKVLRFSVSSFWPRLDTRSCDVSGPNLTGGVRVAGRVPGCLFGRLAAAQGSSIGAFQGHTAGKISLLYIILQIGIKYKTHKSTTAKVNLYLKMDVE